MPKRYSSSRDHWIMSQAAAVRRNWWPLHYAEGTVAGVPKADVRCSYRGGRTKADNSPRRQHGPATHAAGYSYITGKSGRTSSRLVYLCESCAATFRLTHAARDRDAEPLDPARS
jgi:hypothetical protein